jgi:sulfatase maturation enzyme AslB (radical SAM superfamily)
MGSEVVQTTAFEQARLLPAACQTCVVRDTCRGGCAGRRQLQNALDQPDSYCPIIRGDQKKLHVRMAAGRDLPKSESSCTTIVTAPR